MARICLAMQGTAVQSLVQEDPIIHGAAKPALQLLSPQAVTSEAHVPGSSVLKQERPLQGEAGTWK